MLFILFFIFSLLFSLTRYREKLDGRIDESRMQRGVVEERRRNAHEIMQNGP